MNPQKVIIFSAPSGTGKTTIIRELLKESFPLEFSISACSRSPRNNEQNGVDYYFLSPADFKQKIDAQDFLEWEEVYKDNFYGTLRSELERIWQNGKHVLFDVDVVGAMNLKKQLGDTALSIFIMPPSVTELKKRLTLRATDSPENIAKRVAKADIEISYAPQFDTIIINDDLVEAINQTRNTIKTFLYS